MRSESRQGSSITILEVDGDVTGRKCAEQEMAEAKRFAESVVDTIQKCLVAPGLQPQVVSANRSLYETSETADAVVRGRRFGLVGIRQRLTHMGGRIIIESGVGKGTKVTLIAPPDVA